MSFGFTVFMNFAPMEKNHLKTIFAAFQDPLPGFRIQPLNSGHINHSCLVQNGPETFFLQKINTGIFKKPEVITENILTASRFLKKKNYPHPVLNPRRFKTGSFLHESWRIFDYIDNSQTFLKAQSNSQAGQAAKFLSEFHKYLNGLNPEKIKNPLPEFLNFNSRFSQFEKSLTSAAGSKTEKAAGEIKFLLKHRFILEEWNDQLPRFPIRILHGDPKISNFLFEKNNPERVLALIDWDTLMPGPVLYDFGDMIRSATNRAEEDDPTEKSNFDKKRYEILKSGFLIHLKDILTKEEINNMKLAAKTVIYVQALRFLTDFLEDNMYYKVQHTDQNLFRSINQIHLLQGLLQA